MKPSFGLPDRMKSNADQPGQPDYTHPAPGQPNYEPTSGQTGYTQSYAGSNDRTTPIPNITNQPEAFDQDSTVADVPIYNIPTDNLQSAGGPPPGISPMGASPQPPRPPQRKGLPLYVRILVLTLVILLVGAGGWAAFSMLSQGPEEVKQPTPTPAPPTLTPTPSVEPVSPLLFGTNLGLFDSDDQVLTSTQTQTLLQQANAKIIRIPMREEVPLALEVQAVQLIKSLGATPLIILHGDEVVDTALQDNTQMIEAVNGIFGDSVVYYEYGNEEDLLGISEERYTESWNRLIPQLSKIAKNGHFIGPVNYEYDREYLEYFLKNAKPSPNEISWHAYTCDKTWDKERCLNNIDEWNTDFADARAMMKELGKEYPIMITEWNYSPNASADDGKNGDSAFITEWTNKALQTFAANRIFASMQYSATNTAIPLINESNTLTPQGAAFKNQYDTMITQGKAPAPVTSTATANSAQGTPEGGANERVVFSFEDGGTGNWQAQNQGISEVKNNSTVARSGKNSLQVSVDKLGKQDYPHVAVDVSNQSPPRAGQTITAYVYLSSNAISLTGKVFAVDQNDKWLTGDTIDLEPGKWTRLTYQVSSDSGGQVEQIGIQFNTPGDNVTGSDVYIDDVGWN